MIIAPAPVDHRGGAFPSGRGQHPRHIAERAALPHNRADTGERKVIADQPKTLRNRKVKQPAAGLCGLG